MENWVMSKDNVEIAAFVGLDWADQKHVITLQEAGSDQRERFTLDHTPEALQGWIQYLRNRFGGADPLPSPSSRSAGH
jgi:hypothetical protein